MGELHVIDVPVLLYRGYRVFKAREKDAEAYSLYRKKLNEETNGFADAICESFYFELITDVEGSPSKEFWLVRKGQDIVGEIYISSLYKNEEAYINFIGVLKAHREIGLGAVLLGAASELAVRKNCRNITLSVEKSMPELLKWYGKHGYRESHRNSEMFHMVKPLEKNTELKWFRYKIV